MPRAQLQDPSHDLTQSRFEREARLRLVDVLVRDLRHTMPHQKVHFEQVNKNRDKASYFGTTGSIVGDRAGTTQSWLWPFGVLFARGPLTFARGAQQICLFGHLAGEFDGCVVRSSSGGCLPLTFVAGVILLTVFQGLSSGGVFL